MTDNDLTITFKCIVCNNIYKSSKFTHTCNKPPTLGSCSDKCNQKMRHHFDVIISAKRKQTDN